MKKEYIIILAMILSDGILLIWKGIKIFSNTLEYNSASKRIKELEKLKEEGKIKLEEINVKEQIERLKGNEEGKNYFYVDGKKYTDKNSYFALKDEKAYILGKKENYMIVLIK